MDFLQGEIFGTFMQFACEPGWVYTVLIVMMLLSAVGLPIPEEVTLLSVGFLAYMGTHHEKFPDLQCAADSSRVNVHVAAIVAFVAVVGSDFLIYFIGRVFGRKLLYHPRVHKFFPEHLMKRVETWTHKYGAYACGIFRFTPGLRFPGHLACGMLKFPAWKFLTIDGIAALISVPTQIYLIAHYGEEILTFLKDFKIGVAIIIGLALIYFLGRKLVQRFRTRTP